MGVFEPYPATAHVTPSSAVLSAIASTMMASTRTSARRMSSLSTINISERIIFGGALTTIALVWVSAHTLMASAGALLAGCPALA